jgi:hypothetical protein
MAKRYLERLELTLGPYQGVFIQLVLCASVEAQAMEAPRRHQAQATLTIRCMRLVAVAELAAVSQALMAEA